LCTVLHLVESFVIIQETKLNKLSNLEKKRRGEIHIRMKKNQCYNGREAKERKNTESDPKARWEKDIHSLKLWNVQWVVNNVSLYTLGSMQGEEENQIIHKLRPTQANREYGPQYRIQGTSSEEGTANLPLLSFRGNIKQCC
jgi:hypothetical protein